MQRIRRFCRSLVLVAAVAGTALALDLDTVAKGLLQALEVGIENTVKLTGAPDGFLKNEAIKIVMPDELQPAVKLLDKIGATSLADRLVERMNRAAEAAAPAAKDIFLASIRKLSFQDASAILKGKENEATLFLQTTAGPELEAAFLPIVTEQMEAVGAIKAYNDLVGKAKGIPMLGAAGVDVSQFDVNVYVTKRAVLGIFHVLGEQEKQIRQDPKARVTDLLGQVFGSLGG